LNVFTANSFKDTEIIDLFFQTDWLLKWIVPWNQTLAVEICHVWD